MTTKLNSSQYTPHLILPENNKGRDFVVSDLHGYRYELDQLLKQHNFSTTTDRLISVGDLIDRGPDSPGCLDLLNEPWFWAVRGNHEQMLIESVEQKTDALWGRWLLNGGSWILEQPEDKTESWAKKLNKLPYTITIVSQNQHIGICHAEFTLPNWEQRYEANSEEFSSWLWGRTRIKSENSLPVEGIDWLFSGHTIVSELKLLGNSVFLERGAYLGNPITLINIQQWINDH